MFNRRYIKNAYKQFCLSSSLLEQNCSPEFCVDSFTNVKQSILALVGRKLHRSPDSPLYILKRRIFDYFNLNYKTSTGRSLYATFDNFDPIVSKWQNFDSLLVPSDHICRSPSDTYYLNSHQLLRTHTSAHQNELIASGLRHFLIVGDVYRRDQVDRNHYPCFHQLEGVHLFADYQLFQPDIVDHCDLFEKGIRNYEKQETHTLECVTLVSKHLKQCLESMVTYLLSAEGKKVQMRWVKAYFPFTHPSWELEILYRDNWIEILGCGVIEQKILENAGTGDLVGWAFGIGLERLAMQLFEIPDIRIFWSKDSGILSQFSVADYNANIKFKPISRYPQCSNDISFWLADSNSFSDTDFYDLVRSVGGDVVEQVNRIDEFVHPKTKKKSICYRITYRHMERTLTQEEVNVIHSAIAENAHKELGVILYMRNILRLFNIHHLRRNLTNFNVFDRSLKRCQRDWAACQDNLDVFQYLNKEIAYRLTDRIYDVKRMFTVAVDLGCGIGHIAEHLYKEHIGVLLQSDISLEMITGAKVSKEVPTLKYRADEEMLPLKDSSVDLILSASSLHWINDLPGINFLLFFASFLFLFDAAEDLMALLQKAGFILITVDVDNIVVNYPDMFALMYEFRGMAESNASWLRAKTLRRDVLYAADSIYREMYGKDDILPATFQVLYIAGWKPGLNNPKTAKRGSANISFKNISTLFDR
ncbi:putative phenylalanine--tRNA ligase [Trichinella spiralis]|uniref:putative phenylalanine--tRNA ligase n=1 Tax=Trichinella spiralis TaxID=6334 RepID=UPI0001EFE78B|nr:putative phenylalanine--tRNA ligase [Trichinella spiralis]